LYRYTEGVAHCAFTTAHHVPPTPASFGFGGGESVVDCLFSALPGAGFHIVGLVGGSSSGNTNTVGLCTLNQVDP
jgi:hypothetical protein